MYIDNFIALLLQALNSLNAFTLFISTNFIASQALREAAAKLRKEAAKTGETPNADKKRDFQAGKVLPSNEKEDTECSDFIPPKKKVKQEPV